MPVAHIDSINEVCVHLVHHTDPHQLRLTPPNVISRSGNLKILTLLTRQKQFPEPYFTRPIKLMNDNRNPLPESEIQNIAIILRFLGDVISSSLFVAGWPFACFHSPSIREAYTRGPSRSIVSLK